MSYSMVIGANGFIGAQLVDQLVHAGKNVIGVQRNPSHHHTNQEQYKSITCADLETLSAHDWEKLLESAEVVYFVAGFAHADTANDTQLLVNSETPALAFSAANQNCVRKFVWLSTIKVLGNVSVMPLKVDATSNPQDKYAESKWRGEQNLLAAAEAADTELAIIRPPLVYGPGVKGNFLNLLERIQKGGILPLGSAHVVRSMVAVENLCDLMVRLGDRDDGGAGIWHVCDKETITVVALLTAMAKAFDARLILLPVPLKFLAVGLTVTGNIRYVERLLKKMEVDQQATCEQLNWQPPVDFVSALRRTVQWYQQQVY